MKLWIAALLGVVLAFAIGQAVALHGAQQSLAKYQGQVLDHAVEVAQVGLRTVAQAERSRLAPCSDADLQELRYLRIQTDLMADIGRLREGQLVCSAEWGRLQAPVPLPPPQLALANGSTFWRAARSVIEPRLSVDMFRRGSVLVTTAPTAFRHFQRPEPGHSALVLRRADGYVFQSFGDTAGLAAWLLQAAPHFWTRDLFASACHGQLDLCVVAALRNVGMAYEPWWLQAIVAGAGALTGASICLAAVLGWRSRASLPQQIRRAVHKGRLSVVYQPLVRLRDNHLVGAEVLARLTDDQGRAIAPDVFIGLAEQHGLIGTITRQVIHQALTQMQARLQAAPDFYLSINLSASDVVDQSLHGELHCLVTRLAISPGQVVLEITERSTQDQDRLVQSMQALRALGYRFYVDDFGTGYSSLAYLSLLPMAGVKLDRMFTQAIGQQAVNSVIVENVCSVTRQLGVQLVAEGIETEHQAAYMLALHPEVIGQGWWLGRPGSAQALDDLCLPAPALVSGFVPEFAPGLAPAPQQVAAAGQAPPALSMPG